MQEALFIARLMTFQRDRQDVMEIATKASNSTAFRHAIDPAEHLVQADS